MPRVSYDCSLINEPRTIAGVDWSIVAGVTFFFVMAVMETHAFEILVIPLIFFWLLRDPCRRDPKLLDVYRRHRAQSHRYVVWIGRANAIGKAARPIGFNRMEQVF